jgi:protein associated with RNAse G/E
MDSRSIIVRVFKYDGTAYRQWSARLANHEGSLLTLDAEFDTDVQHPSLGTITRGTRMVEYYWLDRWYCIFRFLNSEGGTSLYYCNINSPPTFTGDALRYVDLDIDIVVRPDFSYELLDLDEFETNAELFKYPEDIKRAARTATDELISMIERREFPFSGSA